MSKHSAVARYWVLAFLAHACAATGERIDSSPPASGSTTCTCCDESYERDDGIDEVRAKFRRSETRRIEAHNARTRTLYEHVRASGGYKDALASEIAAYETYVRSGGAQQHEDTRAPETLVKEHQAMAKCDRLMISWVSSSPVIEPEMEIVLLGCQFGVRRGQVFLTLVNSRFRSIELEVQQPSDWNDGDIRAKVPMIDDEADQPARIYLIRTDGTRSDDYPIEFRARREIRLLSGGYLTVHTSSASTDDDFRFDGSGIGLSGGCSSDTLLAGYGPAVTYTYASTSARADHWQSCCWPPTSGVDTWRGELQNGWVTHHFTYASTGRKSAWALVPQEGRVDEVTDFASGSASVNVRFHWWTDQYQSGVKYAFQIFATGPAGSGMGVWVDRPYLIDENDPCHSPYIIPIP